MITVPRLYAAVLDLAVVASSVFIIYWFSTAIMGLDNRTIIVATTIFLLVIYLATYFQERASAETKLPFGPLIKIPVLIGEVLATALWLDSFLNPSSLAGQEFLAFWKELEMFLNLSAINTLLMILVPVFYLYFGIHLFVFILSALNRVVTEKISNQIIYALFLIIFAPLIVGVALLETDLGLDIIGRLTVPLSELIYSRLGWLLGFSLAALHSRYWIKSLTNN